MPLLVRIFKISKGFTDSSLCFVRTVLGVLKIMSKFVLQFSAHLSLYYDMAIDSLISVHHSIICGCSLVLTGLINIQFDSS